MLGKMASREEISQEMMSEPRVLSSGWGFLELSDLKGHRVSVE